MAHQQLAGAHIDSILRACVWYIPRVLWMVQAIKLVWSCHREIITDEGPVPTDDSNLLTT